MPAHVHIYVPDVDETFLRALKAGATSIQAPVQKDDADRGGGFRRIEAWGRVGDCVLE